MPASRSESQAVRAAAFGSELRRLRRERNLTQRQLAPRIPMSSGNLSRIENGEQGPPADETIEALAAALGVESQSLLAAAGRSLSSAAFEEIVLRELRAIRKELREGFARLHEAEQGG
jgi:transcriptional regulator with XRE-family HTH domain